MPADFATRNVHVNDINLRVIDEGEGEPVVLLHGFPDSSLLWLWGGKTRR
jgi:pimeloyl-ACP methyl ester carboxylesterase